ncbi:hypothetical protein M406DRAFT_75309 [Cryphonectria parasitica EP155]|uniref:Uncharacterized protein n=1 Tax=Cryphonectria parasitica (strain ATCC 38755 / EP155) TaxID=660469 RepID=A0A9P4XRW0_CRYP1|nr:uncharacterized protein M406DRAFT_75309 [Cryphonectria parasitica EP155]KAF3759928.1 hypothetical protein M406DRAFT_75309 [Cryphonectria parasitica EP155]
MTTESRGDLLIRLGILPFLISSGHLVPVIGSIHVVTGSYEFPIALLSMICAATSIVDSYDSYKDIPISKRPKKCIWQAWMYSLWLVVLVTTYLTGVETSLRMYRFSLIGLGWGTPCIPLFSPSKGLHLVKPKSLFFEAKSLVVAVCMTYVTADVGMFYGCHERTTAKCTDSSLRARSLCLVILYQFFRETGISLLGARFLYWDLFRYCGHKQLS